MQWHAHVLSPSTAAYLFVGLIVITLIGWIVARAAAKAEPIDDPIERQFREPRPSPSNIDAEG